MVLCALDARHLTRSAAAIEALGARYRTILAGAGANAELAARVGAEFTDEDPVVAAHALMPAVVAG